MKNSKFRKKLYIYNSLKNNKGEMLIETIIAVAMLLVVIGSITVMLMTAINLNNKTVDSVSETRAAIKNIEAGSETTPIESANLKLTIGGTSIDIPVNVVDESGIRFISKSES